MIRFKCVCCSLLTFCSFPRCLIIDGTRLQTETVGAATKTATETEDEDTGTGGRRPIPPVVTETGTGGGEVTDRKEAMHARGGVCVHGGL